MRPEDIQRWDRNQRAAAARERTEVREHPLTAAEARATALALVAFDESLNGSPFERNDPVSLREDEEMRETWGEASLALAPWRLTCACRPRFVHWPRHSTMFQHRR